MSDIFGSFLGLFSRAIRWLTGGNYTPELGYSFPAQYYSPLYGNVGQLDNAGVSLQTHYEVPPKDLQHLSGRLDKHFVNNPLYKAAYMQQKLLNFNQPTWFVSREFTQGPMRQERKLTFQDGTEISSRDSFQKRREVKFYDKLLLQKNL